MERLRSARGLIAVDELVMRLVDGRLGGSTAVKEGRGREVVRVIVEGALLLCSRRQLGVTTRARREVIARD